MIKKILLGLAVILVIMQFFQIDKTNPITDSPDLLTTLNAPAEVQEIIKTSCYDCHSYQTKYPWYTYIVPLSYWIKDHIEDGRDELNFSVATTYSPKKLKHKMEECMELVDENEMPLSSYTNMHSEAKLSKEQKAIILSWFKQVHDNQVIN